jgi:integrase/recombinase XerC
MLKRSEISQKKDQFLTYISVEKNLSTHTIRAYESDLTQFLEFWLNLSAALNQSSEICLTAEILDRFFVHLYHQKIAKSSIARKISALKSFERYLKQEDIILNLRLIRPKLEKKLPIFLTIDEIFYLLENIPDASLETQCPQRDKAILEILYATGVRCSELVSIKLNDIDFNQKVIRVFGKGRKERIVLFGDKAGEQLQRYLNHERPFLFKINRSCTNLFLNQQGGPLTTRSVQRVLEMFRICLKMQKQITPHKIRHTFATHLLNQGVDLRVVQELLGHKSLSSTERYTHVTTSQLTQMCNNFHPLNKEVDDQ